MKFPSLFALLLLLSSCAVLAPPEPREFTLCFLLTDRPTSEFEQRDLDAAMAGHFENMGRLGREQLLLLAGPLGEPRSDPRHRGLFLFDIDDVASAETLARSDPAVAAGVFTPRVYPFSSFSPFQRLPRLEADALLRRRTEDPEAEEWVGRMYVLVSCPDGAAAHAALRRMDAPRILFSGRLGGTLEGTGLFALDSSDLQSTQRVVRLAGPDLEWSFHPWYGTERIEAFPEVIY